MLMQLKNEILLILNVFLVSEAFDQNSIQNDDELIVPVNVKPIEYRMPGTKWCGVGSTAKHFNQLGRLSDLDMCCRDHDICDSIERGQEKYGLSNSNIISKMHCRCDREFRECLKKINSKVSNTIGRIYFSVQKICYKKEHPIIKCKKKNFFSLFWSRCAKYETDKSKPAKYQWFELPYYYDPIDCDAFKDDKQL
uniref:Phospholipase A2 n=1 Tax=Culicoides sonorensis TaxID=179676 RepID=A0A336KM18_CULSO